MSERGFHSDSPTARALLGWFDELHGTKKSPDDKRRPKTGDRARLRRADGPEAVALLPGYHHLLAALAAGGAPVPPKKRPRWAVIAGLLSRVKAHQPGLTLATAMGRPPDATSRAPVAETRVRHLLEADTPEAAYTHLRRCLEQLDGAVDVVRLTQDLLWWDAEKRRDWAYDYYRELPKSSKGDAK